MKFKNILLYAALLSGMSFSSCTDFLDEDSNPNALSPGIFWKSEGDIMKGLTSVYGALQPNASWAIPFERYIVIDGYRSDEITHRDDVTSSQLPARADHQRITQCSRCHSYRMRRIPQTILNCQKEQQDITSGLYGLQR